MAATKVENPSRERVIAAKSGWAMLIFNLMVLFGGVALVVLGAAGEAPALIVVGALCEPLAVVLLLGHFTLQPNESRVLILFGSYHGTVRESGFHWANPFYSRMRGGGGMQALAALSAAAKTGGKGLDELHPVNSTKVSLRAQTLNGERLKVNDKRGNPIEIAAIVIWRVHDTARAVFDVEDYGAYVRTQAESALRHLASAYVYDNGEENEPTLRGSVEESSARLERELQVRLDKAGVTVDEARITHLAYAPEIAQAMLRRQQAEAVIAARTKIVHGAVSMVQMALDDLDKNNVVKLDDERRAAMVSNLLVVLCGETEVSPVVNAGTLY